MTDPVGAIIDVLVDRLRLGEHEEVLEACEFLLGEEEGGYDA